MLTTHGCASDEFEGEWRPCIPCRKLSSRGESSHIDPTVIPTPAALFRYNDPLRERLLLAAAVNLDILYTVCCSVCKYDSTTRQAVRRFVKSTVVNTLQLSVLFLLQFRALQK